MTLLTFIVGTLHWTGTPVITCILWYSYGNEVGIVSSIVSTLLLYKQFINTKERNNGKDSSHCCCGNDVCRDHRNDHSITKNVQLINNPIQKVWIDEGCMVCNACETTCPEVFKVTDEDCELLLEDPDKLNIHFDEIIESAEGCCVQVIRVQLENGDTI